MPDLDPLSGPVVRTAAPAPLQGQPTSYGTGIAGAFTAAGASSLGVSLAARNLPGGTFVPYDDAVQQFKDAGLDPSVLPKSGLNSNALGAIKEQQTIINNASDAANRSSGAGGTGQFVAGLTGGVTDPLFLALGPIGRGAEAAGLAIKGGTALRVGAGAVEGGAVMGGYTAAQKAYGTAPGDADITSYGIVKQTGIGMVFGGAAKGVLGERPLDTGTVVSLEGSTAVAKKLSISPNDVVSPTGAVGLHQVEPATAREIMGANFDVKTLHDPEVNKAVAQKILDENAKAFPGDAEAQTVAYNAGPARARQWIAAGRNDAVLPAETQKYVNHFREIRDENPVRQVAALPPEVQSDAMKTAVASIADDSEVNVDPVIQHGLAEQEPEPVSTVQPQAKPSLVVARQMEDGSVKYGKPGDMHFDLYSDDELEQKGIGSVGVEQKDMGFAEPGGPFMSREEAAASVGEKGRLESVRYQMKQAGEDVPAFGRRDIQDFTTNPAKLAMEHEQEVTDQTNQAYANVGKKYMPPLEEALPKAGSANINERLSSEMLEQVNARAAEAKPVGAPTTGENPELAELKTHTADALTYAQHAHTMAFGEPKEGVNTALDSVLADHEEGAKLDDELAKGVDAAVRCGAMKGF